MFIAIFLVLLSLANMGDCYDKSIFILAGQSNMVGQGGVSKLANGSFYFNNHTLPRECQPSPHILRLNLNLLWEEAFEPLHQLEPVNKGYGIGPGMPFAHSLLERLPSIGDIGLVPCAVSNTFIKQWVRGTSYYTNMLTRARAALLDGGAIKALLWYQGENDTSNSDEAEQYKDRLEKFLTDVRSDLQLPSLPVIVVAITSGLSNENRDIVRKAQKDSAADLQKVAVVDAEGLQLDPRGVHLTTSAQVQLGKILADAFLHI